MQIIFDVDKWIKDAIGSSQQQYNPPLSLTYRSRLQLPGLAHSTASLISLNKFMSERFKEYLKE